MTLKSNFKSDLEKEQRLATLLDSYYKRHLKHYDFERIHDIARQMEGVDVILTHKNTGTQYFVDEKAQLDYINNDLPTFAFELSYEKKGRSKKGWLFDKAKKTEFYALVTAIYTDEPNRYTSCKITFVNREKLIAVLTDKGLSEKMLKEYWNGKNRSGKLEIDMLDHRTEGYLYFSTQNKVEKPINLILKLDFLMEIGVAKRLI